MNHLIESRTAQPSRWQRGEDGTEVDARQGTELRNGE